MGTIRNLKKQNSRKKTELSSSTEYKYSILFPFKSWIFKYKKYVYSIFLLILSFIVINIINNFYMQSKINKIELNIKEKKYEELINLSPELYDLYSASLDNTKNNNSIQDYLAIAQSKDITVLENYLSKKEAIFKDFISLRLSYLLIESNKIKEAQSVLSYIDNKSFLYSIKIELLKSLNIKTQLLGGRND